MSKLDTAKEVILKHYKDADCGIFDTRNMVGDDMCNIYDDNGLQIDICYGHGYFEVFGLTDKEFAKLAEYYDELG